MTTLGNHIGLSIMGADFANLGFECNRIIEAGVDHLHFDVMDGHFVPQLTFGSNIIKCLRKTIPSILFESHMMVTNPSKWINEMESAGVSHFIFHHEAAEDPSQCVRMVKESGMKVGVALNPGTSIVDVYPYIHELDSVYFLGVTPGYAGQMLKKEVLLEVGNLRKKYHNLDICLDGGITYDNFGECAKSGANLFIAGNLLLKSSNPREVITNLRQQLDSL